MTANTILRKEVLKSLESKFKDFGFKLKGTGLIRETETGLYQIIDVGLGPTTSLKANHVGIGFGIATEEWIETLNDWRRPKILTSSHCEIRDVDCTLVKSSEPTTWYPISIGLERLIDSIEKRIDKTIIPFMNCLKTRDEIISMWRIHKHNIGIAIGRHHLAIGVLMILNKDIEEGKNILNNLLIEKQGNAYFEKVLMKVLN